MSANPCLRCGSDAGAGVPQPSRCGDCPPRPCHDCGEPDNAPCRCYTRLANLPLADLKGIFAMTDMSLDPTRACCGPGEGCSEPDCTGTPAAGAPTPEPVDDCTASEFSRSSTGCADVATGTPGTPV